MRQAGPESGTVSEGQIHSSQFMSDLESDSRPLGRTQVLHIMASERESQLGPAPPSVSDRPATVCPSNPCLSPSRQVVAASPGPQFIFERQGHRTSSDPGLPPPTSEPLAADSPDLPGDNDRGALSLLLARPLVVRLAPLPPTIGASQITQQKTIRFLPPTLWADEAGALI